MAFSGHRASGAEPHPGLQRCRGAATCVACAYARRCPRPKMPGRTSRLERLGATGRALELTEESLVNRLKDARPSHRGSGTPLSWQLTDIQTCDIYRYM